MMECMGATIYEGVLGVLDGQRVKFFLMFGSFWSMNFVGIKF
jgi:hypothetical protein